MGQVFLVRYKSWKLQLELLLAAVPKLLKFGFSEVQLEELRALVVRPHELGLCFDASGYILGLAREAAKLWDNLSGDDDCVALAIENVRHLFVLPTCYLLASGGCLLLKEALELSLLEDVEYYNPYW